MKLFECIVDDGKNVFKTLTAAQNKKELLSVYGGNYPTGIKVDDEQLDNINITFLGPNMGWNYVIRGFKN